MSKGERGVVARYLDDCHLRNLSPTTIEQRTYALARFERDQGPLLAAEPDQIRAFLSRRGGTLRPETKAAELSHLRGFFKWAVVNGHLERDPTLVVPRPKTDACLPHPMPEGRLAVAVAHASERVRPWLLLAAFAGLRAQEIAGVRGEDVQWENDPPVIIVTHPKGNRQRAIPLAPILQDELAEHGRSGWLFRYVDRRPGPITPHLVSTASNRYLHKQGIPETLHSLRHRFLTQFFIASGYDLRLTQEIAGHQSIRSTQIYTWVDHRRAGDVVSKLPALELVA